MNLNFRYKKSGFTIIELIITIAVTSIFMYGVGNFILWYYENAEYIKSMQSEHSDITIGLKSLQKIVFENAKYLTINNESIAPGLCSWDITSLEGDYNICWSKFGFVVINEYDEEIEYFVELKECWSWIKKWKRLVYGNGIKEIDIFPNCLYQKSNYEIKHWIEDLDSDMVEKILRYVIYTENWIYKQTIFIE